MKEKQPIIERIFESALWNSRFIILFAVLCSLIASITLFIFGSYKITSVIYEQFFCTAHIMPEAYSELLIQFIKGIDLYLVGIVFIIFSFGVYELFISKIDIARKDDDAEILEVENLDELKNKIIKVIIMVLIVSFFAEVIKYFGEKSNAFKTPEDMLFFALSILAIAIGVFLIKKKEK